VFWGFPPISLCVPVMGKTEVESSTQISDFPKNGFKFFSQISNSHFFQISNLSGSYLKSNCGLLSRIFAVQIESPNVLRSKFKFKLRLGLAQHWRVHTFVRTCVLASLEACLGFPTGLSSTSSLSFVQR